MANLIDIAAMKLNAITTNGTRVKDFIDLVYLSKHLTLNQMLQGYEKKYRNNIIMALKSLFYYDEVNLSEPIHMIEGNFKWEAITQQLIDMQNNPDQLFSLP
jgi:hypothetical protein